MSALGSVGRTTCETAPARHRSRSLLANAGHSWIILPDNVTFRGSLKTRIRMGEADTILCPYCGTRFRFDPRFTPLDADPPDSFFVDQNEA